MISPIYLVALPAHTVSLTASHCTELIVVEIDWPLEISFYDTERVGFLNDYRQQSRIKSGKKYLKKCSYFATFRNEEVSGGNRITDKPSLWLARGGLHAHLLLL